MSSFKPLPICHSCLRRLSRRHLTTTSFAPKVGHALLTTRRLIALSGHDAPHFLQGLTTANIPSLSALATDSPSSSTPTAGLYGAFLNASGRVLHDVFIYLASHPTTARPVDNQPTFLIEVDAHEVDRLAAHLRRFKLRAKIQIRVAEAGEWGVWSAWGSTKATADSGVPSEIGCEDARAPGMGTRIILPGGEKPAGSRGDEVEVESYDIRRIMHGVAEGQEEIARGTALPLESNIDHMGGIDFRKGCYVGQELTIRTHHTGVVRKRILPVALYDTLDAIQGIIPTNLTYNPDKNRDLPPPGANVLKAGGKGRSAGRWIRGIGNVGRSEGAHV